MTKTILFVNSIPADTYGGGEKWCASMGRALSNKGYRVGLAARPNSKLVNSFQEFSEDIFEINFGCDFNPVSMWRIFRFLRQIKADVVILNFNKDVSIGGIAARLGRVDTILFRNGFPIINNKLGHRLRVPFFDRIVTNSSQIVAHYAKFGWGLEEKCQVIFNGITIDSLPVFPRKEAEPLRIIGAGRLTTTKRFHIFADIIARLSSELTISAILAGDGPERGRIAEQIGRTNAPLQLIGHVPAIGPYLKEAALLLHTSRNEGMPNVVMEAMAAGVPVVVTDAGGTRDLVVDGQTGFVCPIDDVDALVEKSRQLLLDGELRQKFGQKAVEHVRQSFSMEKAVSQLEAMFI